MAAVQEKLLTAEEFARLPNDGKKYDLVEGVLVEVCRPKYIHGKVQTKFARFIDAYADEKQLGEVVTQSGHILSRNPDTVRGPDIAFNVKSRVLEQYPSGYVPAGPDLAIEIVSEYDTATEIQAKIRAYFKAGTRLVWIAYPEDQQVYVYDGSPTNVHVVDIDGVLDGGDVLPGFKLPLRDVFRSMES